MPRNGMNCSQEAAELSSTLASVMQATDTGSKRLARLEGIIQTLSSVQDREDASAGLERLRGQLSDLQQTGAGLQAQARRLPLILNPCRILVGHCEHSEAVSRATCFSLCCIG